MRKQLPTFSRTPSKKIILVMFTLALCQACQGQDSAAQLQQGEQALNAGNLAKAIRHFDAVLQQQPQHEAALLLRCEAKYKQKDYAGVLRDAQQVLKINPNQSTDLDYKALWNLGVTYNSLRQFEQARVYLNKAKKADPTDVRVYDNIGYAYLQEQNYAAALAEFKEGTRVNPTNKTSFYGVGKALFMLGQHAAAIQAYDQAVQLDPMYAVAYENRAAAKYQLQDVAGCCADLQKCRELGMEHVAAFQEQVCR